MPEISVVVPVYKVEPFLKKCIDSILRQSFTDYEIILVDDGSPDQCGKICDEYSVQYPNIVTIHQSNGGLSAARNAGIEWVFQNSDSKWISFIDSDDWVKPNYLECLYDACVKNGADIAICDFDPIDEEGRCVDNKHTYVYHLVNEKNEMFNMLYTQWRIAMAWGKLYRASIFKNIRYDVGKLHEDEFIIHKLLYEASSVVIIPDSLYCYLLRKNSITGIRSVRMQLDSLEAHIRRYYFCKRNNLLLDPRFFTSEYINNIFNIEIKEDYSLRKRLRSLKKEYVHILLMHKKLKGVYRLIKARIWN